MTQDLHELFSKCPTDAAVVDVSARDGLQSQPVALSPETRAAWIRLLFEAGVPQVEAGSFVNPRRVPQMAGTGQVVRELESYAERIWVLVLNRRGLEEAAQAGAKNIVCLVSATDSHSVSNQGRPVAAVLEELSELAAEAVAAGLRCRAAVAMAWADPWEGEVPPERVVGICRRLREMGFAEVTLCDTSGGASPRDVAVLLRAVQGVYPAGAIGLHLHETQGVASANVFVGLIEGVARFDASLEGLGGCPFAPGAPGNVDTKHLVRLLSSMGIRTGIDLDRLDRAAAACAELLREAMYSETTRLGPGFL
ncbi:MAG: hydroxymethylglutaryl-CoA lyase [Deferrisomatales bacterium]